MKITPNDIDKFSFDGSRVILSDDFKVTKGILLGDGNMTDGTYQLSSSNSVALNSTSVVYGGFFEVTGTGTGGVVGFRGSAQAHTSAQRTAKGAELVIRVMGGAVVTTGYCGYFRSPAVTSGSFGDVYGIYLEAQKVTGVTGSAYGVRQVGSDDINQFDGQVRTPASTTARSGLRIAHGAAPTSPTDGDIWTTTSGLYVHINGVTIGPLIGSGSSNIPFGFAFQKSISGITVSEAFAFFDTPGGIPWTLPINLTNCQATIGGTGATAPSAQTDFDIQSPPGTSIGTMRFASGSLTATFIKATDTAIPGGQPVQLVAPANLNGMAGTIFGSIVGTR